VQDTSCNVSGTPGVDVKTESRAAHGTSCNGSGTASVDVRTESRTAQDTSCNVSGTAGVDVKTESRAAQDTSCNVSGKAGVDVKTESRAALGTFLNVAGTADLDLPMEWCAVYGTSFNVSGTAGADLAMESRAGTFFIEPGTADVDLPMEWCAAYGTSCNVSGTAVGLATESGSAQGTFFKVSGTTGVNLATESRSTLGTFFNVPGTADVYLPKEWCAAYVTSCNVSGTAGVDLMTNRHAVQGTSFIESVTAGVDGTTESLSAQVTPGTDSTTESRAAQGTSFNLPGTAGVDTAMESCATQGVSFIVSGTAGADLTTDGRAAQGTCFNVSDTAGMDVTTEIRAAQGTPSNVSGMSGVYVTTESGTAQGTSYNVSGTAGGDTATESRAAQGTSSNVSSACPSGLSWMPDTSEATASVQGSGEKEEESRPAIEPPVVSSKMRMSGTAGLDLGTESHAAQDTPCDAFGKSPSELHWMPDSPQTVAASQTTGEEEKEGGCAKESPSMPGEKRVSESEGVDILTEGRAARSTASYVSEKAVVDLTKENHSAQGTSPNVPGGANMNLETMGRAAQSTPGSVTGTAGEDPAASMQCTGKKEEQDVSAQEPPTESATKKVGGKSGEDMQAAHVKFWESKAEASPGKTGGGRKAESAAAAMGSSRETTALQRLHTRVAQHGRMALDVGGEGKCQYMSFAHQIRERFPHLREGAANITWEQICSLLADWLKLNRWHAGEDTSKSLSIEDGWDGENWEDYVSKVRGGLVWGNELTVIAMVNVFETPIRVWTSRTGAEVEWNEYYPDGYDSVHPVNAIEVGHVVENHYLSVLKREVVPAAAKSHPVSGSRALSKSEQLGPQPLQDSRLVLHGLLRDLRRRLAMRPANTGAVDAETVKKFFVLVPSLLDSTALECYGSALAFAQEMRRLAAEAGVQTEELWGKTVQGKPVPASRLDLAEDAAVRDKNSRENQMIDARNWQRWRENEATTRQLRELGGLFPKRGKGGTRGKNASGWMHGKSAFRGATTKPPHSAPGYE
jgi:hypothetical protein